MTFWGQVLATLIGSAAGFIFGIFLFFITSYIKSLKESKLFLKNLYLEARYIKSHYEGQIALIESSLKSNKIKVIKVLPFDIFFKTRSYYLEKSFENGIIYNILNTLEVFAMQDLEAKISYEDDEIKSERALSKENNTDFDIIKENKIYLKTRKQYYSTISVLCEKLEKKLPKKFISKVISVDN